MSLLAQIRSDGLQARRDRDTLRATLLSTLGAEAAMVGKNNGNRESTDEEVAGVARKFLKNNGETVRLLGADPARADALATAEAERAILLHYVDAELTTDEIKAALVELGDVGPKDMGRVMKHLNAKFPGRVDGKIVSAILRQ